LSQKVELRIDWATHEAATFAVENWHYSKRMPKSKLAKVGVWENGKFVGVVIFGVGATGDLFCPYGLKPTQGCELVRIALKRDHKLQLGDQIAKVVATERGGRGGCDVRLLIQAPKTINVQRSNRFKNKKEVPQGG
jgi:hypothetical protein